MQLTIADQLELFYGEASPAGARVYAQLPLDESTRDLQLGGSIYGPACTYAHTLPARFPLADAGPGPTLLAQSVIQEPCFWSADMPYLYTATVELRRQETLVAQVERPLGLRSLAVRGDRLEWEREPYTLRGVYRPKLSLTELPELHSTGTAVLISHPSDEVCREASRCGVLLLALVTGPGEEAVAELRRLRRWPAVGIAVLDFDAPPSVALRTAARNLLLAQVIRDGAPMAIAPWAEMFVVRAGVAERRLLPKMGTERPVVVWSESLVQQI